MFVRAYVDCNAPDFEKSESRCEHRGVSTEYRGIAFAAARVGAVMARARQQQVPLECKGAMCVYALGITKHVSDNEDVIAFERRPGPFTASRKRSRVDQSMAMPSEEGPCPSGCGGSARAEFLPSR